MLTADFEERLKELRKNYLENQTGSDQSSSDGELFMPLSLEEKLHKLSAMIETLAEKKALIEQQIASVKAKDSKAEELEALADHLEMVTQKKQLLENKRELLKNGELDTAKREKLKRQLADLEIRRCKLKLNQKDCSKLEQKITQKKEQFKKIF